MEKLSFGRMNPDLKFFLEIIDTVEKRQGTIHIVYHTFKNRIHNFKERRVCKYVAEIKLN